MKKITAHDIAAEPELFNEPVIIGRSVWECMGYSGTGNTVKFARLVTNGGLRQISKYVDPSITVRLSNKSMHLTGGSVPSKEPNLG